MKCFERLVMAHIVSRPSPPTPTFEPYQFAYHPNHSTEYTISSAFHLSLEHLEGRLMLFLDLSSAFNTIIPQHLVSKQSPAPGFSTLLLNWLLDWKTLPRVVRTEDSRENHWDLTSSHPGHCQKKNNPAVWRPKLITSAETPPTPTTDCSITTSSHKP